MTDWRQDFYYAHPVVIDKKRIPASEAIIARDSKYILWPDYNYEEFFDLEKDSKEKANRISDPSYAQKIGISEGKIQNSERIGKISSGISNQRSNNWQL